MGQQLSRPFEAGSFKLQQLGQFFFPKKWRDDRIQWTIEGTTKLRGEIKEKCRKIKQKCRAEGIRLLVCGLKGHGKSSFINSSRAALAGNYAQIANAADTDYCVTVQYKEHRYEIETDGELWSLPFDVCDFRGLGETGASENDILKAIHGHLENGAKIYAQNNPGLHDTPAHPSKGNITMLIIVVNITTVLSLSNGENPAYVKAIKDVIKYADDNEIPTVVFLTQCDKLDKSVKEDLRNMYYSKPIQKAVQTASALFNRNENRIFPVKNITDEFYVDPPMAALFMFPFSLLLGDIYARLRETHPVNQPFAQVL